MRSDSGKNNDQTRNSSTNIPTKAVNSGDTPCKEEVVPGFPQIKLILMSHLDRRTWLRQSLLTTAGLGLSLKGITEDACMPRTWVPDAGIINLGANENPYGMSPLAKKAIHDLVDGANRYSFNIPAVQTLGTDLAKHWGVDEKQVIVTPGSGEALNLLARYYTKGNIVTAKPTFMILPRTAKELGTKVIEVPLNFDKVHDLDAMKAAITPETSAVYICNPANPTSTVLEPAKLRAFVQEVSQRTMVIVDEAYMELLDAPYNESLIPFTRDNKNLIILKTFSKIYAMAGMRVGYVIAHPDTTNALLDANFGQSSFCVSVLGLTAAIASLKNTDHALSTKKQIIEARDWTSLQLKSMGYRVIPSYTNFIYYGVPNFKGDFAKHMLDRKILMRSDSTIDGNWARVSVGRMDEMKAFVEVMKKV